MNRVFCRKGAKALRNTKKGLCETLCLYVLVVLSLTSCQKENFDIVNLNNNNITALGHSGMGVGRVYPPDTYESILNCLATGADGSEMNVQMTKDCVLVAFHDELLGTNTNFEGLINSYTHAELENVYYDTYPYMRFSIMTLDNLFSKLKNQEDYFFTFDCKLFAVGDRQLFLENYANTLIALIEKHNMQNRMTIESNETAFLLLIQQKQPDYKLFFYPSTFAEGLEVVQQYHFAGITIDWEKISKEETATAHSLGIYIATWNTHTKQDNINAVLKNPDFIQSDKIEHLVRLLE